VLWLLHLRRSVQDHALTTAAMVLFPPRVPPVGLPGYFSGPQPRGRFPQEGVRSVIDRGLTDG